MFLEEKQKSFDGEEEGRVGVGVTKIDYWSYSRRITNYNLHVHTCNVMRKSVGTGCSVLFARAVF